MTPQSRNEPGWTEPRRTALVTGASSGIGEALAEELASKGYLVFLAARRAERLQAVAARILDAGGRAEAVPLDLSRPDEAVSIIRRLDERCGGLDLVVANAGVGADRSRSATSWESMRAALATNFVGAGATLTAVLPQMMERGRGHLVGISSLASYAPVPQGAAYSAPKAGLSMLLECLRFDSHGSGVDITEVKLGFVDTAALEGAQHALPQLLSPRQVARWLVPRLDRRPPRLVHPQPLGWIARWGAMLPERLRRQFLLAGSLEPRIR